MVNLIGKRSSKRQIRFERRTTAPASLRYTVALRARAQIREIHEKLRLKTGLEILLSCLQIERRKCRFVMSDSRNERLWNDRSWLR